MLKFVSVIFAILTVSAAGNYDYFNNGIEYDVSPSVIAPFPYPYHDGFVGNRVANLEPRPALVPSVAIVPEEPKTALVATKLGLVATAASYAIACVKNVALFAVKNLKALLLGSSIALGICKFTSFCNKGLGLIELQREIRSLATPQRLARAAEIVDSAIRKYNAMQ